MDIHAFTGELAKADWNLATAQDQGLIELLGYVYGKAADTSFSLEEHERILVLNDGVARAMDLNPPIDPTVFAQYLYYLLWRHDIITKCLEDCGQAIRTCLAGGERIQYASEAPSLICNPAQFHMNTAFARACIIEQQGRLDKNRVYIEQSWISTINQEMNNCVAVEETSAGGKIIILKDGDVVLTLFYDDKFFVEDKTHQNYNFMAFRISQVEGSPGLMGPCSFSLSNS
jgi:hypothetical protein